MQKDYIDPFISEEISREQQEKHLKNSISYKKMNKEL